MEANAGAASRAPYDLIADRWARERTILERERPYLEHFIDLAPPGAHVLDLGCGTGVVARLLLDQGFNITGVDASTAQLGFAKTSCPEAELLLADILDLELKTPFQGLVAWDSVFHIPRAAHQALFDKMHRWLEPGAPLLLSLGGSEGEFTAPMFGVDFFYSSFAPERSVALLKDAGFDIVRAEIDDSSSRGHLAVLCRNSHLA